MKNLKKVLSFTLALTMCLSLVNLPALAEEEEHTHPEAEELEELEEVEELEEAEPEPKIVAEELEETEETKKPQKTAAIKEKHSYGNVCSLCAEGKHEAGEVCNCCGYPDKGPYIDKDPGKEPEEPECEHQYNDTDRCTECGALNPSHKHSYDDTGKCVCGEEHKECTVTSWEPDYSNFDVHKGTCSVCGKEIEEKHTFGNAQWGRKNCTKCIYFVEDTDEPTHTHNYIYTYDGNNKHIGTCTSEEGTCTAKTIIENCVFNREGKDPNRTYCKCGNSKSNVVDLEPGDDGTCKDGGAHEYGNVGLPIGNYQHKLTCLNCGHEKVESCDMEMLLDEDNKPMVHVCRICGQQQTIIDSNYCEYGKKHDCDVEKEILSDDGKTVFTIWKCKNCDYTFVQDICNSPAHVTVKYFYEDDRVAHNPQSQAVIKGTHYEITSPTIEGYEPDKAVISGISDGKDKDYIVTYKKVEEKYTLTIEYIYEDTNGIFARFKGEFAEGAEYSVKSPNAPEGYEFAAEGIDEVKSGIMPDHDETLKVSYKPVTYTWTIVYVIDGAKEPFDTKTREFTINTIKDLVNVVSPTMEGYTVDKATVPAPKELKDSTVTVTYRPSDIYKLVVNHVYVAYDGSRTTTTETLGTTHKVGDPYTTSPNSQEGYTLTVTPEGASGTFEAKDITLTYEYAEDTFTVTWLNGYGSTVDTKTYGKVTQEQKYLTEYPGSPARSGYTFTGWGAPVTSGEGNITITAQWSSNGVYTPDPDTDDDDDDDDDDDTGRRTVTIEDENVPLSALPQTPSNLVTILDDDVPLGALPQTGNKSSMGAMGTAAVVCGALMKLFKKEDDE